MGRAAAPGPLPPAHEPRPLRAPGPRGCAPGRAGLAPCRGRSARPASAAAGSSPCGRRPPSLPRSRRGPRGAPAKGRADCGTPGTGRPAGAAGASGKPPGRGPRAAPAAASSHGDRCHVLGTGIALQACVLASRGAGRCCPRCPANPGHCVHRGARPEASALHLRPVPEPVRAPEHPGRPGPHSRQRPGSPAHPSPGLRRLPLPALGCARRCSRHETL